jgi:hypothetical protein
VKVTTIVRVTIISADFLAHSGEALNRLIPSCLAHVRGRQPRSEAVELITDLKEILHILVGRVYYICSTPWYRYCEPVKLRATKRLS